MVFRQAQGVRGDAQFLSAPDGTPLWVSDAEPGSLNDITAVRIHVLPALYKAAADGPPTLTDCGYQGAGIGVHRPFKKSRGSSRHRLHPGAQTHNVLLRGVRAPASVPPLD